MKSNFDTYMRKSACHMNDCPYGHDISCRECVNRMIAEHDAKVRAEMQEFVEKRCKELGIDYTLIFTCDSVN